MPQFLLLLRDSGTFPTDISPDEIQQIILRYRDWMIRIGGSGSACDYDALRVLVDRNGTTNITDGPYAEAKEVLGGFMLVEAPDYDAAVALCNGSPHLEFGGSIEVRQIERVGD